MTAQLEEKDEQIRQLNEELQKTHEEGDNFLITSTPIHLVLAILLDYLLSSLFNP